VQSALPAYVVFSAGFVGGLRGLTPGEMVDPTESEKLGVVKELPQGRIENVL